MKIINRRNWLKTSGLLGTTALIGPSSQLFSATELANFDTTAAPVRLSSNENPYGPSQKVRQAMSNAYDLVCRYPYSWYKDLVEMLAKKHGVQSDNIMLTAGSTEGLKMAGLTYGGPGSNIVAADPVFLSLLRYAEHFGTYIHQVPVNARGQHDLDAMAQRMTESTRLMYVCNPNNPTSALEPALALEAFCRTVAKRTMVFADEAYFDYIEDPAYPTMIKLVKEGENVIVARTFSKVYGLAGIRIGYLIARPDVIIRIGKSVMSGPNILAVAAAKTALEDKEFYQFSLQKNIEGRKMITDTLDTLGMEYLPSSTNFVFFKTGRPITEVHAAFLQKGIRVGRPFPPMLDWCRISVGTTEQTAQFCEAAKSVFA